MSEHKVQIEFILKGLPDMTNAKARKHWRAHHKESRIWKRGVADYIIINRLKPEAPFKTAKLTLTRHSASAPDSDGLVSCFKHVIDGLVEAGVLENDKFTNIGMPTYLWMYSPRNKGFITIRVEA
jgi:hypothetical protein